jgi:hypothetical protein
MGEGQPTLITEPPRASTRLTRALFAGGASGNERLAALTGALLMALPGAIGVTIVRIAAPL